MKTIKGNNHLDRCKSQLELWIDGHSVHNNVDNECVPDFSCCNSKITTKKSVRIEYADSIVKAREEKESNKKKNKVYMRVVNSPLKFTEKCKEISGFGGEYEKTCRNMVIAGAIFLDSNPESKLKFIEYENLSGFVKANNEESKDLTDFMFKASLNDCTGAMMQACVHHVLLIARDGFKKYIDTMEN
jgi:hypothetical protein